VNCNCVGALVDCVGIIGGSALPGTPCDDNDPGTANDMWDANCDCTGVLIDCAGVPGGSALPGNPCDDSDPTTGNDMWDMNCNCVGEVIDCTGVPGGMNLPGITCNDGDTLTVNDVWTMNCVCAGDSVVGIAEFEALQVSAFPNPARDILNIELSRTVVGSYYLYDIAGRVVISGKNNQQRIQVPVDQYRSGIYHFVYVPNTQSLPRTYRKVEIAR